MECCAIMPSVVAMLCRTATNPFSSICGRVCDAPCEPACRREAADGAVQIRNLKRFVMERVGHDYDPPAVAASQPESVGIVGAGPAGLVAAHDLCAAGYHVDVYEMTDRPNLCPLMVPIATTCPGPQCSM